MITQVEYDVKTEGSWDSVETSPLSLKQKLLISFWSFSFSTGISGLISPANYGMNLALFKSLFAPVSARYGAW